MSQKPNATPLSLEFVQRLKTAIRDAEGPDAAALSHRVPIPTPGTPAPVTYRIDITRAPDGSYRGTCFEIPRILAIADTEDEALVRTRLAIFNFVHRARRPSLRSEMRRLEQQILCEDHTGRRYRIEVFVTTEPMMTPYGVWEAGGAEECWLDTGNCYQPVNVVEPFEVFTVVDRGRIVILRRVGETGRLPSFLRRLTYASS